MEAYDIPNLFMPQDDYGLSLVPDKGGSYNYFVTKLIWDYFTFCKNNQKGVSIYEFIDFINNYNCSLDKIIKRNGKKINNIFKANYYYNQMKIYYHMYLKGKIKF